MLRIFLSNEQKFLGTRYKKLILFEKFGFYTDIGNAQGVWQKSRYLKNSFQCTRCLRLTFHKEFECLINVEDTDPKRRLNV